MQPAAAELKPAYKIPSMAEIAAVPWNGLRVVSLFSGAGGGALGLRWAGYKTVFASEFDAEAAATYRANNPGVYLDTGDVRDLSAATVLGKAGLRAGEADLMEFSPPCASYSVVGKKETGWGKEKNYSGQRQRTDDLFEEALRLLGDLRPRAFIAENVPGLISGASRGKFLEILSGMRGAGVPESAARRLGSDAPGGYEVLAAVIDARFCGVPQSRERLIFMGIRLDVLESTGGQRPAMPAPLPYQFTLGDACPWLASGDAYEGCDDPAKPTAAELAEVDLSEYPVGKEAMRLKPAETSRKYHSLIRCSAKRPAYCITQASKDLSTAGPVAPFGCRKFTAGELKRIGGFPDDFTLTGSRSDQWERIGRAVAPPVYRACGLKLMEVLAGG